MTSAPESEPTYNTASRNFHVHTVHIDNYQRFLPTDAQLDGLKNNFKFVLKLTLKSSYMFRCKKYHLQGAHYLNIGVKHHPQGAHYLNIGVKHHPQGAHYLSIGVKHHPQAAHYLSIGVKHHLQGAHYLSIGVKHHPQGAHYLSIGVKHHF
jgi:hypothetical protein